MATEFTYTMASVNLPQLEEEIQLSSITIAIDRIDKAGTDVTVHFKADISAGEETTLDTLTADHVAQPVEAAKNPVLMHEINTETGLVEPVQFSSSEGRSRVLASTKPVLPGKILYFYWAGVSDDVSDPAKVGVGNGNPVLIDVEVGDATKKVDLYFGNYSHGELVYIAGGAFQWENTTFGDAISMIVMAAATPTQQSVNLDYNVDGDNRLIATTPGTGTHGLAGTPVFVPHYCNKGYWNLTADFQAEFRPGGDGMFDWYTVEREAARFVNQLPLFGTETKGLQLSSPETSQLPAGYFLRICCHNGTGTAWKLTGSVMLYREIVGDCAGM